MAGILYLIPNVISDNTSVIPRQVQDVLPTIQHFLAEDLRTARRYLSSLAVFSSIESLHFEVLDKNTKEQTLLELMKPLVDGHNMGVISESGCPGVADPGALAVWWAQSKGYRVVPLVGPSSLLLALMASGLNGQHFAFHGYLPIDSKDAAAAVRELEKESRKRKQTQMFIETPYRNNQLFSILTKNLHPDTRLSIALDVTGKDESIMTKTVKQWQSHSGTWPKLPAVFMFLA